MLKKLALLCVFLQVLFVPAFAQPTPNEDVLKRMSREIKAAQDKNYAEAVALAAKKGWPLSLTTKNGNVILLTGVDFLKNPIYISTFNNTIAAATTRTNQLWPGGSSGLNLTGSSDAVKGKLGIWDGGSPLTTHVELTGRVTVKDGSAADDHATHVSGTMIASGVNPIAKGMAYGTQQLVAYNFSNDVAEMTAEAPNLLLSNHSYGNLAGWNYDGTTWSWYGDTTISRESYLFGRYSNAAQLYDSISYNAPYYLVCFSSGNSRNDAGPAVGASYKYNGGTTVTRININNNPDYGSVPPNATAKNVLLVGAVNGLPSGYQKPTDVSLASFSSAGATDDGRIKPDVVADGVNVTSSSSAGNTSYEALSGTSMSCPNTTGSLYLLQEYYTRLHPGNFMRAATVKALAIHTADEAGNNGPDYYYGWGLLNVLKAANVITSSFNHRTDTLLERTVDNGANATYSMSAVASGAGNLVATIVWNDPPGTVNNNSATFLNDPTPKLTHDLDLRITRVNGGTVYLPWVLNKDNPSAPATRGDNTLDNVEQVAVSDLIPGETYTITVSHKGTLARSTQPFSLVVSGIGGAAYCTSAPTSNTGARIDEVDFGTIAKVNGAGCTTYNNYTGLSTNVEVGQTLPLTVKVSSCDASSNPKIVKAFIDFNNNGSFTDAGELIATSGVIATSGTFTTNITLPATLTTGTTSLLRIVVQETSNAANVNPCGSYGNGETQDYKLSFVPSSNDVELLDLTAPQSSDCPNPAQYITVKIRNNGTADKQNLPVTVTVKNGAATVASFSEIFKGTVPALSTTDFTFQTPFNSAGGITYTYEAIVSSSTDPYRANDTLRRQVTVSAVATPSGVAEICGPSAVLKASNPVSTDYFWYTDAAGNNPIATGSNVTTTTIPANNTYYLTSGGRETLGPVTKTVFSDGGYNTFSGNSIRLTSTLPSIIETARLYTGTGGTIKFVLNPMASATSYYPSLGDSITLNVYATAPTTPTLGAQVNDPADTGATYRLNLKMDNSVSSNYILFIYSSNGASIYRNNNITTNPYPIGFPGLVTITSNSATPNYQNFYYFLYNAKVRTLNECVSAAVPVVAAIAPTPAVTQSNDSLVSSSNINNQWNLNGVLIPGATDKRYKPTQNGTYTVTVTDNFGCQRTSAGFNFLTTAINPVANTEVALKLSPNPSNGLFTLSFKMTIRADLKIELINLQGQPVFSKLYPKFTGPFAESFKQQQLPSGIYVLRIQHGVNVYYNKVAIQH